MIARGPGGATGDSSLSVTAFRHCHPAYAEPSETTLRASAREGGRFNPQQAFGALYVSLSEATAVRELRRRAARLGVAATDLLPRKLLRLRLRLARVLDLCDPAIARAWGLSPEQLRSDELTACQEVGRAARREGYEAIRFPAATGTGDNVAIFLDRLHAGSTVVMEEARDLEL